MENITSIIAIDCGAQGGIVAYKDGKVTAVKMPKTIEEVREYLEYWKGISKPIVFMEKVGVRPDDIKADGNGVNMGKLFRIQKMIANYEQLKASIEFSDIPYIQVHPMKWQNGLNLRIKGEQKPERKKRYKDIAQNMYPTIKATMWNCDALLILQFGRKMLANDIEWVRQQLPKKEKNKLF